METDRYSHNGPYKPLDSSRDEIRLLILPDNDPQEGPLAATFSSVSLNESPVFYALSYVWGDPAPTHSLAIDGSSIKITENLNSILRAILSHQNGPAACRSKALWVDALCINQRDMDEKQQQIPLMGRIYSEATRVLMWIGDPDEHSDWAFTRMNDADVCSSAARRYRTLGTPTEDEIKLRVILDRNLEERPYWSRVWILQEMVLPRSDPLLLSGSNSVPWSQYVNLLKWLPANAGEFAEDSTLWDKWKRQIPLYHLDQQRSSHLHRVFRESRQDLADEEFALSSMLGAASAVFSATNPLDRVYGMQGMLRHRDACLIEPDYRKSAAQVFKEACTIMWQSHHPDPVCECAQFSYYHPTESPIKPPSWVPDLSSQSLARQDRGGTRLNVSKIPWQTPSRAKSAIDGDILRLEAIELDAIDEWEQVELNYGWSADAYDYEESYEDRIVAPLHRAEVMWSNGRQRPLRDTEHVAAFREVRDRGEPIWKTLSYWPEEYTELPEEEAPPGSHESVWKHLVFAQKQRVQLPELGQTLESEVASAADCERGLLWEIALGRQEIPEAWKKAVPDEARTNPGRLQAAIINRMLHAIRKRSHGRRIFTTRHGFFGVGASSITKGDMVVFVVGMCCPFVLRPFQDGYQMIGFAYVAGLGPDWRTLTKCVEEKKVTAKMIKIY